MLLTMAACQKIDVDTEKEKKSEESKNDSGGGSNGETNIDLNENSKPVESLADGTLFVNATDHVAALVLADEEESQEVLFISLAEWRDVYSAKNMSHASDAIDIASHYREGDLTGWRIPTKAEARMLKDEYLSGMEEYVLSSSLQQLNATLTTSGGEPVNAWLKKTDYPAYRYLCEDATYTFSLKSGSTISAAGKTTKYNLRLVKDSVIIKQ